MARSGKLHVRSGQHHVDNLYYDILRSLKYRSEISEHEDPGVVDAAALHRLGMLSACISIVMLKRHSVCVHSARFEVAEWLTALHTYQHLLTLSCVMLLWCVCAVVFAAAVVVCNCCNNTIYVHAYKAASYAYKFSNTTTAHRACMNLKHIGVRSHLCRKAYHSLLLQQCSHCHTLICVTRACSSSSSAVCIRLRAVSDSLYSHYLTATLENCVIRAARTANTT
eukprot:14414-Heterococcus_DN1.PRE.9